MTVNDIDSDYLNAEFDLRDELRSEYARELYEERRSRYTGCKCGNPDWPGRCPGWRNCPLQQEDSSDE